MPTIAMSRDLLELVLTVTARRLLVERLETPFLGGRYSSTSRWALMPPNPKALTAARLGVAESRRTHFSAWVKM
jgi:hypothetical protein